jgi:hypothetical protein
MLRNPNSLSKKDTIIEDPAMEPYFMTRSATHEFTVFERVTKGANNKKYLRVVGYPSTFGRALNMIVILIFINHGKKCRSKSKWRDGLLNVVTQMFIRV